MHLSRLIAGHDTKLNILDNTYKKLEMWPIWHPSTKQLFCWVLLVGVGSDNLLISSVVWLKCISIIVTLWLPLEIGGSDQLSGPFYCNIITLYTAPPSHRTQHCLNTGEYGHRRFCSRHLSSTFLLLFIVCSIRLLWASFSINPLLCRISALI